MIPLYRPVKIVLGAVLGYGSFGAFAQDRVLAGLVLLIVSALMFLSAYYHGSRLFKKEPAADAVSPVPSASRNWTVELGILCVILIVVVVALASTLSERSRFVQTKGGNPYIMFDNKTAQSCWAGPGAKRVFSATPSSGDLPAGFFFRDGPQAEEDCSNSQDTVEQALCHNPEHLPFCKNLK